MSDLDKKIAQVLLAIVSEYIETAHPVGSLDLADKYKIDFSSATIRNYMNYLEDEGFLDQPHISSGRVPTEQAYQYYLSNHESDEEIIPKKVQTRIHDDIKHWHELGLTKDRDFFLKLVAKMIAEISGDLVIVEFKPNDVYYTGLTYLYEQPEFGDSKNFILTGQFVDQMDDVFNDLRNECSAEVNVFLGSNNPINDQFSLVLSRYEFKDKKNDCLFGLVGPVRMPYTRNVALLKFIKDQLLQTV